MRRILYACLLVGLAGGSILSAQDISGTIGGSILDPSGAAVPGAKITITSTERNQVVRTVKTDASGTYSAVLLPVGIYSLKVKSSRVQA